MGGKKTGRKLRRRAASAAAAAASVAFLLLAGFAMEGFGQSLRAQQLSSVQLAVQRAVIHCYALEGSYPPSLDYLAKNYGLVLDRKHYIYDYSVFASNVPPEVHVLRK